jgi:hypothetical protein
MAMAFVIFVINGNVAFLAFSGSCYWKSIPAAVVNGKRENTDFLRTFYHFDS